MRVTLETALLPHQVNLAAFARPTLFNGMRIYYSDNDGWKVEQLSLWQRLTYIFSAWCYGTRASLRAENQRAITGSKALPNTRHGLTQLFFNTLGLPIPFHAPKTLAPGNLEAPPRIRGILNTNKVNCWLNASLQVLFQTKNFRTAIYAKLERAQNEEPSEFEKRLKVQDAVQVLYEHYSGRNVSDDMLFFLVNTLKERLYQFKPNSFGRKNPLSSQQCSSVAIHTLRNALLPGISDISLEKGNSLADELSKHLITWDFWNVAISSIGQTLDNIPVISKGHQESDSAFANRQGIFQTLKTLRQLYKNTTGDKEDLLSAIQGNINHLKEAFGSLSEEEISAKILETLQGDTLDVLHCLPETQVDITNLYLAHERSIHQIPPILVLLRTRLTKSGTVATQETSLEGETPLALNLEELSACGSIKGKYRLAGIVHHESKTTTSGHYTATINHEGTPRFVDDHIVQIGNEFSSFHAFAIYERID